MPVKIASSTHYLISWMLLLYIPAYLKSKERNQSLLSTIWVRVYAMQFIPNQDANRIYIVLENLYLGFLFYQVYKIVIAIIGVIALGFFVFIPLVKQLITIEVADNKKDK